MDARRLATGSALAVLAVTGCAACAVEEWRNADLGIDVVGSDVADDERVRLCVDGVGLLEQAAGTGRLGFPGIPAGEDRTVTVDVFDGESEQRRGRAGPVTLGADNSWAEVAFEACETACEPCTADGERAGDGAADWLLAVRFVEGA